MFEQFQVRMHHRPRQREISNALLALVTGILTLVYPDFLYLIAGGYLVALGLVFMLFRLPSAISAIPVVAGIFIFVFPELIPITFAIFLALFGFVFLFLFQFSVMGVIALVISALIIANPDWIAYLIAAFLLIYGVSNLIETYQNWRRRDEVEGFGTGEEDDGQVSIQ